MHLIDRHTEKQTNDYYLSSTPSSYGSHCSTKQLNRIASSATSFGTCSHIIACVLGSCQCVWGTGTAPPQVPARPQRLLLQRQVFQGRDSQHPQSNQKLTKIQLLQLRVESSLMITQDCQQPTAEQEESVENLEQCLAKCQVS